MFKYITKTDSLRYIVSEKYPSIHSVYIVKAMLG